MEDNQGGVFWRQGYAQLSKFSKLTQVLFKFKLREPENGRFPVHGNVSVDEVKLECASIQKKTVAATECKKHKVPSVGCIHLATEPTTKGRLL